MKKKMSSMVIGVICTWVAVFPVTVHSWSGDISEDPTLPLEVRIRPQVSHLAALLAQLDRWKVTHEKKQLSDADLALILLYDHNDLLEGMNKLLELFEEGAIPPRYVSLPDAIKTALENDSTFDETHHLQSSDEGSRDLDYWFVRISSIAEDLSVLKEFGYKFGSEEMPSDLAATPQSEAEVVVVSTNILVPNAGQSAGSVVALSNARPSGKPLATTNAGLSASSNHVREPEKVSSMLKPIWVILGIGGLAALIWLIVRRSR